MNNFPCNFDHNGECLICDAWPSSCAFERLLKRDFTYESLEQLLSMFSQYLTEEQVIELRSEEPSRGKDTHEEAGNQS